MARKRSAFLIAAAQSGSGKTTLSLGLIRALVRRGLSVQPFKCGPDYIDPGFHALAAGSDSINLDSWMMGEEGVQEVWSRYSSEPAVAVVEGVMGLFDGRKPGELDGSSADIARLCRLPVILVVDAKGMSGSIAALVAGYATFHSEVTVVGVIANKVGSSSHAALLREALEKAALPPLLGYLPRNEEFIFPERHLGLVPQIEALTDTTTLDLIATQLEESVDINRLLDLTARELSDHTVLSQPTGTICSQDGLVIAIAYDEAFHFYYRENLTKLEQAGATLVYFSPLKDTCLPEADWIYIGGGFPEIFAKELEENSTMRDSIGEYAQKGGCIFAECGGYVYLCNCVTVGGETFNLCGVIDGDAVLHEKRQALGYRTIEAQTALPFLRAQSQLRGHEYHYTTITLNREYKPLYRVTDSRGFSEYTGVCDSQIYAAYPHCMW